jgi:transcriptional regulator GlxA family with amidase domain
MKNRKMFYATLIITNILIVWLFEACSPVREFMTWENYKGNSDFIYTKPKFNSTKKTVIIIADNDGTEIFDMMTPFYLFNATEKANVYIVAEKKYPVTVIKGFFLLPHYSFDEFDSSAIKPDVIVIPNLSAMDAKHQNPVIVSWIKKHYSVTTKILSVCDGSMTAAATGIYDGKLITTHASDYANIKKQFTKPIWIKDVSVTSDENLFSTGGVSNAVEGSLTVINRVFDTETMMKVKENINYPHLLPKTKHQSIAINFNNKLTIGNKVIFKKNKRIGVLLQDGVNEFELASIMDTYNRTFPSSIESFLTVGKNITSKYGLTIIPTGNINSFKLDELHILNSTIFSKEDEKYFEKSELVKYENLQQQYIIDLCLDRISKQYGKKYQNITKLLLDYN